jgi:hypothetical protein
MNDMGILTHEYLHGFFLVDLYDADANSQEGAITVGGVANYDIMANPYGWNKRGNIPSSLGPYSRWLAGWLQPIEITQDGVYAIQASAISSQIYNISAPYPSGEYLLIENRVAIKWDSDWPTGGLVIWHVDEKAPGQQKRGYPGQANWPLDHYQVAVQQADGLYNIEKGENLGDEGDFWVAGQVLGPGPSFPNTDSYQGQVVRNGLKITVLSQPGLIMNFQVEGLGGAGAPYTPDLGTDRVDPSVVDGGAHGEAAYQNAYGQEGSNNSLFWIFSMLGSLSLLMGVAVILL